MCSAFRFSYTAAGLAAGVDELAVSFTAPAEPLNLKADMTSIEMLDAASVLRSSRQPTTITPLTAVKLDVRYEYASPRASEAGGLLRQSSGLAAPIVRATIISNNAPDVCTFSHAHHRICCNTTERCA